MSIAKKLLILLTTLVVALSSMSLVNLTQTRNIFEAANFGNENVIPSIIVLDKVLMSFSQVRVGLYRHVVNTDSHAMEKVSQDIEQAASNVNRFLKDYEPLIYNAEDRRLWEAEKKFFTDYFTAAHNVLALSTKNQNQEALHALSENALLASKFNEALQQHMVFNENLAKAGIKEAQNAKSEAGWINGITALLALMVTASLTFTTRRQIVKQLQMASVIATRVASGDLSTHPFKTSHDEIGQLLNTLEKMRSVHDKFHRTLILSGFCFLKIAKISLNSSFFPKPIKR